MQKIGTFLESFFRKIFSSIKLKEKFLSFQEYVQEHKILSLSIVFGMFIFLLVLILILKPNNKHQEVENIPAIELEHELILPIEPDSLKDYYIDREIKDKWDSEEIDEWFTKPQGELFDDLQYQNDRMIQDILEAAP